MTDALLAKHANGERMPAPMPPACANTVGMGIGRALIPL
jgi:hypothetical protein